MTMKGSIWHYLKSYPISLLIILAVTYLSFFKPPSTDLDDISNLDKVVHVCMYFGISLLLWWEFFKSHPKGQPLWHGWIGAVLLPVCYGGIVELLQASLTDYRGGDWWDFLSDAVGVLLALLVALTLLRRWFRS